MLFLPGGFIENTTVDFMKAIAPVPSPFAHLAILWILVGVIGNAIGASPFGERRVLVVGIDGCRPDALLAADTPHLQALIDEGVLTTEAYAGGALLGNTNQATSSGPGWSSILTGVWRDKHGVFDNSFAGNRFDQHPHFYHRLKQAEPEAFLASIVSWNPIDTSIVAPATTSTSYRTKGIGANYAIRDEWVRDDAVRLLRDDDPDVLFLHFDQVDGAGHADGFSIGVPSYLQAISKVDALLGDVLAAIEARPHRAREEWLVLVTTDHGGLGTTHGGQSSEEREIFLLASGDTTASLTLKATPGHTAIPPTVFAFLGVPIDSPWGWESPFGLPPYPPSSLRVTQGLDRDMVIRWKPPLDIDAEGLLLRRNGVPIAELPLETTFHVDTLPPIFLAVQIVYALEVVGSSTPIPPLEVTMDLPTPIDSQRVLHWRFDQLQPFETKGAVAMINGPYRGQGLRLGSADGFGNLTYPLASALKFERFTDFSIGLWLRVGHDAQGFILGTKPLFQSRQAGWVLSLLANGSLQWNLGDGIRQTTVTSPPGLMAPNQWHHIGVRVHRLQNVTLYHNGIAFAEEDVSELRASDSEGPFTIGGTMPVDIDDLQVWKRRLSDAEWARLFDERAAPFQWRESQFTLEERLHPEVGAWSADPDHDGRVNLAEFVHGSDPRVADSDPILRVDSTSHIHLIQPSGGVGDPLTLYEHRGVRMHVETSANLSPENWQPLELSDEATSITRYRPDGSHAISFSPPPTHNHHYYRLRYTLSDD